jgi:hypothetical protein
MRQIGPMLVNLALQRRNEPWSHLRPNTAHSCITIPGRGSRRVRNFFETNIPLDDFILKARRACWPAICCSAKTELCGFYPDLKEWI